MVTRRLAAILCADVVGFSRLAERDETLTHTRLLGALREVFEPAIVAHGGRIVKTTGDGILAEFASATSAVRCAVEAQRSMASRNASLAADARMDFRVGINLGDIIVEGDDIFGDGVNVAARLEGLAEPGGICVSGAVRDQVHEDLGVQFADAGTQQVKNITKPIHVYRIALDDVPAPRRLRLPRRAIVGSAALALLTVALAWVWSTVRPGAPSAPELRSVLIVPFLVEGADPALAAVTSLAPEVTRAAADGMRQIRVVPADAAAAHAGKSRDAVAMGRDANVRFVVETDLRRSGMQASLTVRIFDTIDARQLEAFRNTISEAHLADATWMSRQLTFAVRGLVRGAVTRDVAARGEAKATTAQDLVDLAGAIGTRNAGELGREQRRLADAAIKLNPKFAPAWVLRAQGAIELFFNDFSVDASALPAEADADSMRAVALDDSDGYAWLVRANALRMRGNTAGAFAAIDRARDADPTTLRTTNVRGWTLLDVGKTREALAIAAELRDFGVLDASGMQACFAHRMDGDYDRAIEVCERVEGGWNPWTRHANLAVAYAMRGDVAKAAREKERLLELVPALTISRYEARFDYALSRPSMQQFIAGLRKAGVPE